MLECYTTAGQADYLLHVLVASIGALDALLRDDVSRMPGVERLSTTVGMKTIKRRGRITDCAAWTARALLRPAPTACATATKPTWIVVDSRVPSASWLTHAVETSIV